MTEAVQPKPVSRAAFDIFAKEDPIGAQLVLDYNRIVIVEQSGEQHGIDSKNRKN